MFRHLVTVVSCQIQQIRARLAAHGRQIIGLVMGETVCVPSHVGDGGQEEAAHMISKGVIDCLASKAAK